MDANGRIRLEPVYDAIGEFKEYGYAVMQRQGKVGMLNLQGKEVISPKYDDLKVLDSLLIAVMDGGAWMVVNLDEEVVLEKGYQRVQVWESYYLAFMQNDKWGIKTRTGRLLCPADYDAITFKGAHFITQKGDNLGLLNLDGKVILSTFAQDIKIYNDSLFFYKEVSGWGAVDEHGKQLIPPEFDNFSKLSDNFIQLVRRGKFFAYSILINRLISDGEYDAFYPFSKKYLIVKENRQLGLLDWVGNVILKPQYNEIQAYGREQFRANQSGQWGIVGTDDEVIIPFKYQYIAPLRQNVCVVKKAEKFGMVNAKGEEIIPVAYDRLEQSDDRRIKAYKGESLTLFYVDAQGNLLDEGQNQFDKHYTFHIGGKPANNTPRSVWNTESEYQLEQFEWFYSPQQDRWGLRRLDDGSIQIEPKFDVIQVEKELGFTLVAIDKKGDYEFERTSFQFDRIYGIVNNEIGRLVTSIDFWDVRLSDFENGYPVARCVFSDGRHGLVTKTGKIIRSDFAYIGTFKDGLARMSLRGRLSGSMKRSHSLGLLQHYLSSLLSPNYMTDYTQYDRDFEKNAYLICEDCQWGFIDTSGQVQIKPQFTFAENFVNDVGIVSCGDKWGMINRKAEMLIPCRYDGIDFLENTDNQMLRVYIREPKYGLIDTLGQLAVSATYEEIGYFREGRLAVQRNGLWGFVDRNGLEIIPCRFTQVNNFSNGFASVRLGNSWGFIDKQGNTEIEFQYKRAGSFRDGLAWVYVPEGIGYINTEGEMVIPPQFDRASNFDRGVANVMIDGEFGLINTEGDFIQKPKFTYISEFDQNGLAIVRYGNSNIRYGVINLQGDMVTKKDFREINAFQEGLAVVKYKDGYGYIDTEGELVIADEFSKANDFSEGYAAVQKNGNCGYIDRTGKIVVDLEYSKCLDFSSGRAVVYRGARKAGLIDTMGNQIIEPSLNRLLNFADGRGLMRDDDYRFYYITEQARMYDGYYERATEFQHGVAVVQIDGKWGIINQKGIEIIPPKYDKIEHFENGYAKVRIRGFNGLTNLKGELIVQPDYEYISYAGLGLFRVEKGDKVGYFDSEGKWVWALRK